MYFEVEMQQQAADIHTIFIDILLDSNEKSDLVVRLTSLFELMCFQDVLSDAKATWDEASNRRSATHLEKSIRLHRSVPCEPTTQGSPSGKDSNMWRRGTTKTAKAYHRGVVAQRLLAI
jgi:hypothetical protein